MRQPPKTKTCETCPTPLPAREGRGQRPRFCAECKRSRARARERQRYHEDADFRASRLEARRGRYREQIDREHERAKRYYREHRGERLAAMKARREAK